MKPPKDLAASLDLAPRERVLAVARSADGKWYAGTSLALYLPGSSGGYRRLAWEQIERAEWSRDSDRLAVVEVASWGEREQVTVVQVEEPGRLLELIRERVTKSVLCTLYAPVKPKAGLTVVARRSPSGRGPVTWSYLLSPGLDPADPDVIVTADETLARAQREIEGL